MKKSFFLYLWPVTAVMLTMIVANFLLVGFVIFQPAESNAVDALQATPATPDPAQMVFIPNTGDNNNPIFFNIFSNWIFWTTLGMALLFFLFLLMAKSGNKHRDPEL